jgi:hypothetical protein
MASKKEKIEEAERKAEPVVDNGLRRTAGWLNRLADNPYSLRVLLALCVVVLVAWAWVRW